MSHLKIGFLGPKNETRKSPKHPGTQGSVSFLEDKWDGIVQDDGLSPQNESLTVTSYCCCWEGGMFPIRKEYTYYAYVSYIYIYIYHGNPKPLFLGVMTHILRPKTFIFHGFGVQRYIFMMPYDTMGFWSKRLAFLFHSVSALEGAKW